MARKKALISVVFSLMLGVYSFAHAADEIKLKFANGFPSMHRNSVLIEKFCKELTARSNGKSGVTHYAGGTLLTFPKIASGILTGIAAGSTS